MGQFNDLSGMVFGRLSVLSVFGKSKNGSYKWLCQCECGNSKIIQSEHLRDGHSKSCGCLAVEKGRLLNYAYRRTHEMSKTRFYRIWALMIQRCYNPKMINYSRYGGRGVKVCDRWLKFENFRDDMYKSYQAHVKRFGEKDTTIERKNSNKNYELNNCTWATQEEQNQNKRNNRLFTYKGETRCINDWARVKGIKRQTLAYRINILGWSFNKAIETTVRVQNAR